MPVRKVKGGYKWGKSGKTYKSKAKAKNQGKAIYASGYKGTVTKGIKKERKTSPRNLYEWWLDRYGAP